MNINIMINQLTFTDIIGLYLLGYFFTLGALILFGKKFGFFKNSSEIKDIRHYGLLRGEAYLVWSTIWFAFIPFHISYFTTKYLINKIKK